MSQPKAEILNENIEFIESLLSEELLLASEDLFDKQPFLKITESSRGNWDAIIQDHNIHFTTSVNVKNKRLKKHSCDCVQGRKHILCKHVVISIYHIRKQQKEKEDQNKAQKPKTRLNLRNILDKIEPSALQGFALEYARKNRAFKLVLQARFITDMEEGELISFFESIYPTHTKTGQKVTAANLSVFINVASELIDHFKGLLHLEEFTQAYFIVHKLLVKSFYIKHYIKGPHKGFDTIHNELLRNYQECHRIIEAPEYREHMISQLVELLSSSFVDAVNIREQELWMIAYENPLYYKILAQSITDYLHKKNANPQGRHFITMLSLMITDDQNWTAKIKNYSAQETYQLVQILIRNSKYPKANQILACLILNKELNHTVAKNILDHSSIEINENLESRIIEYYIRLKKNYYLSYLKNKSSRWTSIQKELISKIKDTSDCQTLIDYYLFNQEITEASKIINDSKSWELIQAYDNTIIVNSKEQGYNLYHEYILHYLQDHFGSIANQHLEVVLIRARILGGDQWVRNIKSQIKSAFPHRDW